MGFSAAIFLLQLSFHLYGAGSMTQEGAADLHTFIFLSKTLHVLCQTTYILVLCNTSRIHVLGDQDLCKVSGRQRLKGKGRI